MIQNKISQRISTYKLISSSRWSDFCVPTGDFSGSRGDWITKISEVTKPFTLWVSQNRPEQNHKKCRRYSVSKNRKNGPFFQRYRYLSFQGFGIFFERFWTGQLLLCRFQKVMGLWWSNLLQSAEMHFSASTREHLSEMPATNHNVAFWHTRNFIGSRIFFKKKHWFVGKNAWALACWHGLLSGFVRAVFCYFFVRFFCFSFFLHNKL